MKKSTSITPSGTKAVTYNLSTIEVVIAGVIVGVGLFTIVKTTVKLLRK